MKVISLQSGSNGNCIYVETDGVKLLFDAGISGHVVEDRFARHGRDVSRRCRLISHDHIDHCRSMGIRIARSACRSSPPPRPLMRPSDLHSGEINDLRYFVAGETIKFGKVTVETISTPHDAEDGVVFVVDDGKHRLGILTDLGHVFDGLGDVIASLDAVLLESNYDPELLANCARPEWLKKRIAGPEGHISNFEAAELSEQGCVETNEMGLPGPSFRGQQYAEAGPGYAPQDSGRPAAAVRGKSVRGQ